VSVSDTDTWVCRQLRSAWTPAQDRRIGDVVAVEDRPCPVPADLHGYLLDDAAANHVANRRPAKIV